MSWRTRKRGTRKQRGLRFKTKSAKLRSQPQTVSQAKPKFKAVPIKLGESGRRGMASWTKSAANRIVAKVRRHVGKQVVLYGGGGFDANLCTLKSVKVEPVTLYAKIVKGKRIDFAKPQKSKTEFYVTVELYDPEGKLPPYPSKKFSPHLGSWKLAEIKPT